MVPTIGTSRTSLHRAPRPPCDRVDVWVVALEGPPLADDLHVLSPEERARAERFRDPRLRDRFALSRARQRQLLAGYLGRPPAALEIARRPCPTCGDLHGKPHVLAGGDLAFSFACRDVALLAVAVGVEVGVDVEEARRRDVLVELQQEIASPEELAGLCGIACESTPDELLWLWVRKEAALKAVGVGLATPPNRISVGPPSEGGWRRVSGLAERDVHVRDLDIGSSHAAAVAVVGTGFTVSVRIAATSKGKIHRCLAYTERPGHTSEAPARSNAVIRTSEV